MHLRSRLFFSSVILIPRTLFKQRWPFHFPCLSLLEILRFCPRNPALSPHILSFPWSGFHRLYFHSSLMHLWFPIDLDNGYLSRGLPVSFKHTFILLLLPFLFPVLSAAESVFFFPPFDLSNAFHPPPPVIHEHIEKGFGLSQFLDHSDMVFAFSSSSHSVPDGVLSKHFSPPPSPFRNSLCLSRRRSFERFPLPTR